MGKNNDDINAAIKVMVATVKSACERLIARASYDKTLRGVITGVPTDNSSYYKVRVNGGEYDVPNYTDKKLSVGKSVWVLIPCNDYSNMFILATR